MTCQELTNDLLVDYADWRIGPEGRSQVARHLELCEPCRLRRDDLEVMTFALGRSAEPPPPALVRQLDRAILGDREGPGAHRGLGRPRRLRPGRLAGIAAGLLLAGLVGFLTGRRQIPGPLVLAPAPGRGSAAPGPSNPPGLEEPDRRRTPPPPALASSGTPGVRPEAPPPADPARAPSPGRTSPPAPLLGDLNGDGVVDIADVRILEQRIMKGLPLPPQADVNGDGVVDIADVRALLRAVLDSR